MKESKVIELWANDNIETHGGENNAAARRVLCPATGRNAWSPVLDRNRGIWRAPAFYTGGTVHGPTGYVTGGALDLSRGPLRVDADRWTGVRTFGDFWSDHPDDVQIGGGGTGQINQFDYVSGMPDMVWAHFHVVDCEGYDLARITWAAESLDYEGLVPSVVADPTDNYWADIVNVWGFGVDVLDPGLDYVNYPPSIWCHADDTLANEGQGTSATGPGAATLPGSNLRPRPPFSFFAGNVGNTDPPWNGLFSLHALGRGVFAATGITGTQIQQEGASLTTSFHNPGVPASVGCTRGMFQVGRTWRSGATERHSGVIQTNGGWRLGFRVPIGIVDTAAHAYSAGAYAVASERVETPYISGLKRMYLMVQSTSVPWGASGSGINPATFLASTPVGPATAPRQHIKGRLYINLIRL